MFGKSTADDLLVVALARRFAPSALSLDGEVTALELKRGVWSHSSKASN